MVLQIRDINLTYNQNLILSNININFNQGEIVGLVGKNGSGKTSMINIINGLQKPTSGIVSYNGENINSMSIKYRSKFISVVPQKINFPTDYKVIDLVYMGRNPYIDFFHMGTNEDLEITYDVMEMTNIVNLSDKLISEISGGEIQRVAIAMALNQRSPILLLDEPTSNLDLINQVMVLDLVKKLKNKYNTSIILSIHDLTLASKYCDRIVMLKDGILFAEGKPLEIFNQQNIEDVFEAKVRINKDPLDDSILVIPEII